MMIETCPNSRCFYETTRMSCRRKAGFLFGRMNSPEECNQRFRQFVLGGGLPCSLSSYPSFGADAPENNMITTEQIDVVDCSSTNERFEAL